MEQEKQEALEELFSPSEKQLLEIINTSYLSVDDIKWLKKKRWFKKYLKIYSKELKKRIKQNNHASMSNSLNNTKEKIDELNKERNVDISSDEVIEILDFSGTIEVKKINDIVSANEKAKKKIKTQRFIWGSVIVLSVIVFLIALFILIRWLIDAKKTDNMVEEIYEIADVKEVQMTTTTTDNDDDTTTKTKDDYDIYANMSILSINFENLLKVNSDTKGWVMVPGTEINYPFVQYTDNNYYLKHSYDKSSNKKGWVFLDYRNNVNDFDKNTVLYAHGLVNNQMFGSMRNIVKENWYTNSDNHFIKTATLQNNQVWQVFSTYTIEPESYYIITKFNNDDEFLDFVNTLKKRSVYDYNVDVSKDDKILTLSSCYSDSKRMVLHAKLISNQ